MTLSQLDAMLAESGVAPDEGTGFATLLAPLTDLAAQTAVPSAELRALFDQHEADSIDEQVRVPRLGRPPRGRGAVVGAVVLALSGVGGTGLSAAANTLPGPLQHEVSQFSHHYLPFNFPEPARSHGHVHQAPDARLAPKPGSSSRQSAEIRGRTEEDLTRSLDRVRRAMKGAPAWAGRDPEPGHGSADRAVASPGYSRPRDQWSREQEHADTARGDDMAVSADAGERPGEQDGHGWGARHEVSGSDQAEGTGRGGHAERGHGSGHAERGHGSGHSPEQGDHESNRGDADNAPDTNPHNDNSRDDRDRGHDHGADHGDAGEGQPTPDDAKPSGDARPDLGGVLSRLAGGAHAPGEGDAAGA
jgi:hypothetical protein